MISASHNPFEDNGIKVFARTGYKLPDAEEHEIEEEIFRIVPEQLRRSPPRGSTRTYDVRPYLDFLLSTIAMSGATGKASTRTEARPGLRKRRARPHWRRDCFGRRARR